jgi:transposase
MVGGVVSMSGKERERAFLVRQAVAGGLSQREASERAGIGVRQFKRLVRAWRAQGDAGLVSRQRGRPSRRRMSEERRMLIVRLLRDKYADFGATWRRRSCWSWIRSRSRPRRCAGSRLILACGVRSSAVRNECFSCASAVRGSAS